MDSTAVFARHNDEVRRVWEAFHAGRPIRVPMTLGMHRRIWIQNPALNTEGVTWQQFTDDPEVMFQTHLKYDYYVAHNIPQDAEMGIPSEHWTACAEFGNVTEEVWLGAELFCAPGQVTASRPTFQGARKEAVFERGIPDPFSGIFARNREFHEYFVERARNFEFHGRPVSILPPGPVATDGILQVAFGLRGAELLEDLYEDEDYFHRLLSFVTDAIILKMRAWRKYLGQEERPERGWFADDSIALLSREQYATHVLPHHRRYFAELWGQGPHHMHLCGDVQRHLPFISRELNVDSFDTGFPIDFGRLREEVGEGVTIWGGVRIDELLKNPPDQVVSRTREILHSGICRGGRFVIKEANNLPPCVPLENLWAMYQTVRTEGAYPGVLEP